MNKKESKSSHLFLYLTLMTMGLGAQVAFSSPRPPGTRELAKALKSNKPPSEQKNLSFAYHYVKGKSFQKRGQLTKACKQFQLLSKIKGHPLTSLVGLRVLETCKLRPSELEKNWVYQLPRLPHWIQKDYFEISYEKALEKNLPVYASEFLFKRAGFEKIKKDKEKRIQKALSQIQTLPQNALLKSKFIESLYKVSPRFIKDPIEEDFLRMALDFDSIRNFKKARFYNRKVINSLQYNLKDKNKAWYKNRLSYKKQGRKDIYLKKTEEYIRWLNRYKPQDKDEESYRHKKVQETKIELARGNWSLDKRSEAIKILSALIKEGPSIGEEEYALANWVLGQIYMEMKKYSLAIKNFKRANKVKKISEDLKEKILWSWGWNLYLKKEYKKANWVFNKALKEINEHYSHMKFSFWKAKTLKKLNLKKKANSLFTKIIKKDPISYYGIISFYERKAPIPHFKRPIQKKRIISPITFNWLLLLNEKELAKEYLKNYLDSKNSGEKLELIPLFAKSENYYDLLLTFFRLSPEERVDLQDKLFHYIFPRPYRREFKKARKKFPLPKALPFSIARQESAFDHMGRSWADAYGLMQLTPRTAKVTAKKHNIALDRIEDLYDPYKNIKLGTAHLWDLRNRMEGNFISMVASYNANENTVKKWKRERHRDDPIEFIEMIPYEETQTYVKLVIRNYVNYLKFFKKNSFKFPKIIFDRPI